MTQGNPFGNKGGRWMTHTQFRALWNAERTLEEIAEANERSEGWKPSRSAVRKHADVLGLGPRNASHRDLLPWRVRPEHHNSEYRHMLAAESRRRQKIGLTETDKKLISRLNDELFGRGTPKVIGYHPEVGFFTTQREEWDDDIIRHPRTDRYADPGIDAHRREEEELREA